MRPYTLVFWVSISGLQLTLALSEQNERSLLCIKIEEEGHLTPAQANSTVGPWAKAQYEDWNKTGGHDEFWYWLHRKWAPDAAGSIIECKLSSVCSVVTCGLISDKHDLQDQWNAYWTLESIAMFHNMAYEIRKANLEASVSVRADVGTLLSKFSDGSNIEQHKLQHDRHWKIAGHVICAVAVLITTIGIFVAALITVGVAVPLASIGITLGEDGIRMIAASAGLFNSGATTALTFGTIAMGPKEYVHTMTNMIESSQKQNSDRIVDRFDAYIMGLFIGRNDSNLPHLVQKGGYVNSSRVLTPEHNAELRQRWAAAYVSSIWNVERTYIVMSDTGNCESDSRGFKDLRVCLDEAPQYVFYAFSKSILREGTNHKSLIRGPIGHSYLKSSTNFTLEDVVRASFVYSNRHGYSANSGAPEGSEDIVDSFFGPKSAKAGGKAHGLFNIPILYSPGGQAISSVNTRANRNYPCMAAALPWSKSNDPNQHALQGRDMEWTDNDPETMAQFLSATGFYHSGDWWGYCHGSRKNHGNHCRGDESIDWTGKLGDNQYKKIRHPFKHCKSRKGHKNGFVGCEYPKNNGYDKNRPGDCAKQRMAQEFVADVNTQWINGTALEVDDMDDDEGEMSDWSDGDGEDEADADDDDDLGLHNPHDNKTEIASRFYA
jgi:hypothetical protein